MMTTGKVFNIGDRPSDPLLGNPNPPAPPPPAAAPVKTKEELLQEYVEKFAKGEITEEQLKVITKTLK